MCASWAAKMTDTKSISSVEVPEGKLMKKVSAFRCQNMSLQCPESCHGCSYKPNMIYCLMRPGWHCTLFTLFTTFKMTYCLISVLL